MKTTRSIIVLCMLLLLSTATAAVAGPRGATTGEPKRSYGSIDVIMYQTSW